jgi:hypothetical protein
MGMRAKIVIGVIVLSLAALAVGIVIRPDRYHSSARRAWKNAKLIELRSSKPVEARAASNGEEALFGIEWIEDDVLRFANGEWIQYRSQCHKEDSAVYDIFLGRGSDGVWYYSTFHFCRNMVVLQMSHQPASLASFRTDFCLTAFDGTSDVCLMPTWPVQR